MAVGLEAVLPGELQGAEPEVTREAAAILQRQVDEAVRSPRHAAASRLLAFEANAIRPPGLPAHESPRTAAAIWVSDSVKALTNSTVSRALIAVEST